MTKSELIERFAVHYPQLVAKDAEAVVKTILDSMAQSLAHGQHIEIRGFGSFGSTTIRRGQAVTRSPERRSRFRQSTCRTSKQGRNCASGLETGRHKTALHRQTRPPASEFGITSNSGARFRISGAKYVRQVSGVGKRSAATLC
jgi:nucleoid DNA-binding protein